MAMAIMSLLAALAIPTYAHVMEGLKVDQARTDLLVIANQVQRFRTANDFRLPNSLAELGNIPTLDPWKNAYQYLNHNSNAPGVGGKIRKDHNLHPINSEFDLYSKGKDGDSVAPLTSAKSRDDIVYARDGGFIGKAEDF